jgi:hypothetical protein
MQGRKRDNQAAPAQAVPNATTVLFGSLPAIAYFAARETANV